MKKILTILLMLVSLITTAQDLSLYQKREYTNSNGAVLPYRILYPESYDKTKKYPLVLFLHGAGERGSDNELQLTHGAKLFLQPENRSKFPCFVIFPQCPAEDFWASVRIDRSKTPLAIVYDYNNTITTPLLSAIEVVKKIITEESINKSQVYITGLSMGGMGTFEAVYRYPDLFAAAAPICGGGDVNHYNKHSAKTAFWVFHGQADPVVDVKYSRDMVDKLKALKAKVKYTEYPGVTHNSWDNAFAEPDFMPWLFSHKRKK